MRLRGLTVAEHKEDERTQTQQKSEHTLEWMGALFRIAELLLIIGLAISSR